MPLVRKPDSRYWWIDITVPPSLVPVHGKRIRRSTGIDATPARLGQMTIQAAAANKAMAQQYYDKVKAELWRQDKLGEAPSFTFGDALKRWRKYATEQQIKDRRNIEKRLEWWGAKLGLNTPLASIKRRDILDKVEGLTCQPNPYRPDTDGKPASPATINHYLKTLRALLRLCATWEMIQAAPSFDKAMRAEPRGRVRALTMPEIRKLIGELPEHWRPIILFALATGLRKSNVVKLRWEQVDLTRRRLLVGSDEFKNGEDFGIPLNEIALGVLERMQGQHETHVFTYEGRPMNDLQHRTWKKALAKAGIQDFRWHDNRHTFATMFIEAGGDLDDLQKLGGWKSREMVLRYAHFRTDHLRGASSLIDKALGDVSGGGKQVIHQSVSRLTSQVLDEEVVCPR